MGFTDLTLKKLFSLSGNECAFPGCHAPIVDSEMDVVVGEICHIKAKSPAGPRYDPNQTEEDRNGYANLIVMCGAHNKIVDDTRTRDKFPIEVLKQYKGEHEAKNRNTVVTERLMDNFVNYFKDVHGSVITTHQQSGGQNAHQITNIYAHPPLPKIHLTPIIEVTIEKIDKEAGFDIYIFRVNVRNESETTVRDFRIDVELPEAYANRWTSFASEVMERRDGKRRVYRKLPKDNNNPVLYAGDILPSPLSGDFFVAHELYVQEVKDSIIITVYAEDQLVNKTEYPIADLLDKGRLRYFRRE